MATYLFSDYEALSKTVNVQPRNAIYWETFSCPPTPQDTATPPPPHTPPALSLATHCVYPAWELISLLRHSSKSRRQTPARSRSEV